MAVEFDAAKCAVTLEARGLDMVRVGEVFVGATLTVEDDRQDCGEEVVHHRVSRRQDGDSHLDTSRRRVPHHQHEEGQ